MSDLVAEEQEQTDQLLGKLLDGKFELLEQIGRGGYGTIYRALQRDTDRTVAVKVMLPKFIRDGRSVKRFQNEAKILSQLQNPNIAQVYGLGVSPEGYVYLTMEYLDGTTLDGWLAGKQRSSRELVDVFKQVAAGIAHAHANNILHRDLKPQNILVLKGPTSNSQPVAKVLDFGVSKLIDDEEAARQDLTASGVVLGSPRYMSPEQCSGGQAERRSDIYAFGCMLYEALCGRVPFERDNYPLLMIAHVKEPPPPIPPVNGDALRATLSAIAIKCLSKQPEARYASMDEIVQLMGNMQSGKAVVIPREGTIRSRLPTGRLLTVLLMLIPAALIVGAIWSASVTEPRVAATIASPEAQHFLSGQSWKLRDQAKDETDPGKVRELLELSKLACKEDLDRAIKSDKKRFLAEYAKTVAAPGWRREEYAEAARVYKELADWDEKDAKAATSERHQHILRRGAVHNLHMAYGFEVCTLGNRAPGRELSRRALALDNADGLATSFSCWPAEMEARYDGRTQEAAECARKTLRWVNNFPSQLDKEQLQGFCSDAIVDLVSTGMTVKEAREEVFHLMSSVLRMDPYKGLREVVEKALPDDSEAQWRPARQQMSFRFVGKVPR